MTVRRPNSRDLIWWDEPTVRWDIVSTDMITVSEIKQEVSMEENSMETITLSLVAPIIKHMAEQVKEQIFIKKAKVNYVIKLLDTKSATSEVQAARELTLGKVIKETDKVVATLTRLLNKLESDKRPFKIYNTELQYIKNLFNTNDTINKNDYYMYPNYEKLVSKTTIEKNILSTILNRKNINVIVN